MTKKRTPWFDGDVQPARVGVYEREFSNGIFYSHWDGFNWYMGVKTLSKSTGMPRSLDQYRPWRGLAQEPKGVNP